MWALDPLTRPVTGLQVSTREVDVLSATIVPQNRPESKMVTDQAQPQLQLSEALQLKQKPREVGRFVMSHGSCQLPSAIMQPRKQITLSHK